MKVTIIKDDSVILVNGRAISVDLSDLPVNLHAVQWDGVSGHVEYKDAPNTVLEDISPYQTWIDRWEATRTIEDAPPPPKTPEQLKAEAIKAIDAQRDAALAAGVTFNGAIYHSDALFQSQLQAFLLAWIAGILPPTATVAIRRKDNTTVQMDRAEVAALSAAVMQYVQSVYAKSWVTKDNLP